MAAPTIFGLTAVEVDRFSGLNTILDATNLPPYCSPDAQDVAFAPGLVKTRPGTTTVHTYAGNPTINYEKQYKKPDLSDELLAFTGDGDFYVDGSIISSLMLPNTYANSVSLFGREYIAFGDGHFGTDIPRQWDGTNFDRVSQVGPGAGPGNIRDFVVEITTLSRTAGRLTVDTAIPHDLAHGDNVQISGVVSTTPTNPGVSFNGTFPVWSVMSPTQFVVWQMFKETGIVSLSRVSGVVTVQLVKPAPNTFIPGFDAIIQGAPGFNGVFNATSVSGSTVTWNQVGDDAFAYSNGVFITQGPVSSGVNTVEQDGIVHVATVEPTDQMLAVRVGYEITLAGVSVPVVQGAGPVPSFNGTWTVTVTDTSRDLFFFTPNVDTFGFPHDGNYFALSHGGTVTINIQDATGTGGFAAAAGNIEAGIHQVSVMFKTRQGYITRPSPPVNFLSAGGTRLELTGIPIGPANVLQRIIIFTAASGSAFFYIPKSDTQSGTVIEDNTTTTAILDFSDLQLISGVAADSYFNLVELGECVGVTQYASRLFWWGERNKIDNFLNLTFDGGFDGDAPLGWMIDQSPNGMGGTKTTDAIWDDAYQITSDLSSNVRALITQSAYRDVFKVPILNPDTFYSVRVSAKQLTALTGFLAFDLFSPTYGILAVANVDIPSTDWEEYIVDFSARLPMQIPTDLQLRVFGYWPVPAAAESFIIDDIQIFPTAQPYNTSLARVSKVEDPESYDGITGFLLVSEEDGLVLTNIFSIRDFLYPVKQRKLTVTADDSQNEPSTWTIREVSSKVGTFSARGVGLGDEWAIIAGQDGVYLFNGGEPEKISQEIQPTWDGLNWLSGFLTIVKVDTKLKRIYVGKLFTQGINEDHMLVLDYVEGFADPIGNRGVGRKWMPWHIRCNSLAFIEDLNNNQQLYIGNAAGNGKIYALDEAVAADDGVAIDSYWQSGYVESGTRLLMGYLSANITGVGVSSLVSFTGDQNRPKVLRGWSLSTYGDHNKERQIQAIRERISIKIGTNFLNHSFSLQGLYLWVKPNAASLIRGRN